MNSNTASPIRRYLREWGGMLLGLMLFCSSLPLYESWSSRQVFDRWSYSYFAALVFAFSGLIVLVIVSWIMHKRHAEEEYRQSVARRLLSVSALTFGIAYFLNTLHDPVNGGRVFDFNVVGSTFMISAGLELISIAALVLAIRFSVAHRLPNRWHGPAMIVATLAFIFVAGEGVARAKAFVFPRTQGFPTYSTKIWSQKNVKLNSFGFRDQEYDVNAQNATPLIVVIGDSFAFGHGLADENDRFGEQLEARINDDQMDSWKVINVSRGDTHTLQHIQLLTQVRPLGPNLVILLYVFNDMDYLAPITARGVITDPKGQFGKLHPGRVLFVNFYLFQEIYVRLRKVSYGVRRDAASSPYDDESLLTEHIRDLMVFTDLVNQFGAIAKIVPFNFQLSADSSKRYSRFLASTLSAGLPICSMQGAFELFSIDDLTVNNLDGHPNSFANSIAVQSTLDCILDGLKSSEQSLTAD